METLPSSSPQSFTSVTAAVAHAESLYDAQVAFLRKRLDVFIAGGVVAERVRAFYPFVQVDSSQHAPVDSRLSYGFLSASGVHRTTLTNPALFRAYLHEQLALLHSQYDVPLVVGLSDEAIPIHFALGENFHVEGHVTAERLGRLGDVFDLPDLASLDDRIPNGVIVHTPGEAFPLALFSAARVDLSLQRLRHYTATSPAHFQGFVLFTNYQFYVDEFVRLGHAMMAEGHPEYTAFVEPGNVVTVNAHDTDQGLTSGGTRPARLPQMPAYHLKRADGLGVTLINIGVGPSNAKTITDHLAALRPHAWVMLGHCAGLRESQHLGDYVLAHAYVRDDHVMDDILPTWVPLPALAEVQLALEAAVAQVSGLSGYALKSLMRTGTVATVDDRNWELMPQAELIQRFNLSRAIALDMESATVAANGYRFRIAYGTLLCVSDKPMHGHLKLPGMADQFYRERVDQHLKIGLRAMEILRQNGLVGLHSRKLRSFQEPAFR